MTVEKGDLSKGYTNPKKEIGGNHAFFRDNCAYIWKENAVHSLYFGVFLELWLLNYL